MIGLLIACDHAEAAHPRLLRRERRLAAGVGQPFPFDEPDEAAPAGQRPAPRGRAPGPNVASRAAPGHGLGRSD